jgi:maleate isomerase
MVKGIVEEGVDAIAVFCTNLAAAQYAERWEKEYGVPVLDSVTTVVWDALRICGVDTSQIRGWGRLMELDSL